jgi:hypothetical protein
LAKGILEALGRPWSSLELRNRALDFSIDSQSSKYLKYFGVPSKMLSV